MRLVHTALRLAFLEAQLGIEDDPMSPNFGWLCVQSPGLDHWVLIADLKPHGALLQPTLLGWTGAQWESAWNDLLVYGMTHPGYPPVAIPRTTEQAVYFKRRWLSDAAPDGAKEPATMSDRMFEVIRQNLERSGLLTGGPKG